MGENSRILFKGPVRLSKRNGLFPLEQDILGRVLEKVSKLIRLVFVLNSICDRKFFQDY